MKLFLINLLKEHDVPGFRTQNAWSKEAWTNIVCRLNAKFGTSFSLNQVKQKEQDLKKDYRSVKDLLAESGFGWDKERMMVDAPASVWASFAARKNSKEALHWQDRSFPYFDALAQLYDGEPYIVFFFSFLCVFGWNHACHFFLWHHCSGRHAEGRTRHGMDHYASKAKDASVPSVQAVHVSDTYQPPSPMLNAPCDFSLQFPFDDKVEEINFDFSQPSSTPVNHTQVPPSSTEVPEYRRGKKQKNKYDSPYDGFHERYLKLKKEEIDRFAAIEEKKLEDPYSINKCITVLEGLHGLQMGDILVAADIFKTKENREVFLSFCSDALRLAWIKREIDRHQTNFQD